MTDEFFWLTFAGLGVSLAGFAGLIHALDRSTDADSPITKWRINNIVAGGFTIALSGLLVWPVFRISKDVEFTVSFVSGFLVVFSLMQMPSQFRSGPAWQSEYQRRIVLGLALVLAALFASNVFIASVGFLELLFVLAVAGPMGTFANAVKDLYQGRNGSIQQERDAGLTGEAD